MFRVAHAHATPAMMGLHATRAPQDTLDILPACRHHAQTLAIAAITPPLLRELSSQHAIALVRRALQEQNAMHVPQTMRITPRARKCLAPLLEIATPMQTV